MGDNREATSTASSSADGHVDADAQVHAEMAAVGGAGAASASAAEPVGHADARHEDQGDVVVQQRQGAAGHDAEKGPTVAVQ